MKYIISAGGTGGHIYPGIIIADELVKEGHEVIFIASKRKIDRQILKDMNFKVKHYNMGGFERSFSVKSIFKNILNLFLLFFVSIKLVFLYIIFRPKVVIGMGGYISYPVLKIAKIFRKKTCIHEQNSYPGLVNRKLASKVDKVFYTYETSLDYFNPKSKGDKYVYTSNPRIEIAKLYRGRLKKDYVLFMGGSLGAEAINDLAIEFSKKTNTKVIIVVGSRYFEKYIKYSSDLITIINYLEEPLLYISEANVIVTRGGATTLIECVALDSKIVAIPSPNVVANHQTLNAKELEKFAIIRVLKESEINIEVLVNSIDYLMNVKSRESVLSKI
ncbi:MAG: UDP-N-acetylglucosamine--N-acetylmuramyl-(pentapeptide) pyrophosphoryl-undecaprenol N-acetylglucosamine transferase, partial [Mycoplasmatales bacterium]